MEEGEREREKELKTQRWRQRKKEIIDRYREGAREIQKSVVS